MWLLHRIFDISNTTPVLRQRLSLEQFDELVMPGSLQLDPEFTSTVFVAESADPKFPPSNTPPKNKAPAGDLPNALKGYDSLDVTVGGSVYKTDKGDMTHILERHHPDYWNGTVKDKQTFFNENMTIDDVKDVIKQLLEENQDKVNQIGANGIGSFEAVVDGVTYHVGLNKGHVGQLYPVVK